MKVIRLADGIAEGVTRETARVKGNRAARRANLDATSFEPVIAFLGDEALKNVLRAVRDNASHFAAQRVTLAENLHNTQAAADYATARASLYAAMSAARYLVKVDTVAAATALVLGILDKIVAWPVDDSASVRYGAIGVTHRAK
jgi:hypothetical protein